MEASVEALKQITARDTWTADDHREVLAKLQSLKDAPGKLRALVAEIESASPDAGGASAVKIGIARYMLCRFDEALEMLTKGTDNKDRRYYQAMCHKHLRQYDKAAEELERAKDRGWDGLEIELELVEVKALAGLLEEADKALAKLENKAGQTAQFHYLRGMVLELGGLGERAVEEYLQARLIDPAHVGATFRLAYYHDLHGQEEQAIEMYKTCLSNRPVRANALLNLSVLYEDAGRYDAAADCLRRILGTNPRHARARLFLKDVEASRTMYYDEDQAKRIAKRNAVLDIPVTDFELSVRARNCLKKMNIRCLGDLVRATEAELLGYKNFGETSLKEIKDMMAVKGLRLGQAAEEGSDLPQYRPSPPANVGNEGLLATSLDQVEFSVRARRALESLGVRTLGELATRSEAEMLVCRNFGQTSLNEVRQRLSEYGLQLRDQS